MDNAEAIHQLLVAKANELNLPQAFHRDLNVHDLNSLKEAPNGQLMLWGIGEMGTHMLRLSGISAGHYYTTYIKGVDHWFLIKDGKLEEVNAKTF